MSGRPLDALSAGEVIAHLGLEHLEGEGVWIGHLWRNESGNAISCLVTPDGFSALHRLREDELWVHVAGAPIDMLLLTPGAPAQRVRLGHSTEDVIAHLVPGGTWQGSTTTGEWSLVTCSLAPAFSAFELADGRTDLSQWPEAADRIKELIRG